MKTISFCFGDICVSVELRGKGTAWNDLVRMLFSGFSPSCQNPSKKFTISDTSRVGFWTTYKKIIAYILAELIRRDKKRFVLLHASAVARSKKVYVFMGESGTGKSTACRTLLKRGFEFITDDTLIIDVIKGKLLTFPKHIEIKKNGPKIIHARPKRREIELSGGKLVFIFLTEKLDRVRHRRLTRILSVKEPEARAVRVENLEGAIRVIANSVNLKNVDHRRYLEILLRRNTEFYTLNVSAIPQKLRAGQRL